MRTLLPLLLTLILQAVVTAIAAIFDLEAVRPEPAIAVIVFAAVRLDPVAGAVVASAIGFTTDLMASAPPGLHMLAFTVLYLGVSSVVGMVGVRSARAAAPLVLAASATTRVMLALILALFAEGGGRAGLVDAQIMAVAIDGLLAVPIWLLLELLYARFAADADLSWRRS